MSDVNTHLKIKVSYETFIKNFSFSQKDDSSLKANKVFRKSAFLFLSIELLGFIFFYIYSVFILKDGRPFAQFVTSHSGNLKLWVFLLGTLFGLFLFRYFLKHMYKCSEKCQVKCSKQISKIVCLSKEFPQLGQLIKSRIKSQGYLSELDYNNLCIDRVHRDLESTQPSTNQ